MNATPLSYFQFDYKLLFLNFSVVTVIDDDMQEVKPRMLGNIVVR